MGGFGGADLGGLMALTKSMKSSPLLSRPFVISSSKTTVLSTGLNPEVGDPPIEVTLYSLPAVNSPDPLIVSFSLI